VTDLLLLTLAAALGQSATTSPSPSPAADAGGFPTGPGLIVLAVLIGGLLLMRSRLLRR
jgi:hypothetical protein